MSMQVSINIEFKEVTLEEENLKDSSIREIKFFLETKFSIKFFWFSPSVW